MTTTTTHDRADLDTRIAASVHRIGRRVLLDAALTGKVPEPGARPELISVRQLTEHHPGLTEPAARQMIARALRRCEGAAERAAQGQ